MSVAIQFYHLTTTPFERALPKLLEKALAGKFRVLLLAESDERVEQINQMLWIYDPGSFLPHGSVKDGHCEQQPVLLSSQPEPLNGANVLLVTDGRIAEQPEQFERILDMFDGNNPESVEKARGRWTLYKNAGHSLSYMKQTAQGGWEKAA